MTSRTPWRRVYPPRKRQKHTREPRIAKHTFDPYKEKDYSRDFKGRLTCRTCQAPGAPGDSRHHDEPDQQAPPPPVSPERAAEMAAFDAAILGETGDDA